MTHELLAAGFGGQGVMAIGKLIAEAAVAQGMNATWLPTYGAEVRCGVANCCCVLTEGEVVSPVVVEPNELILMNEPSFHKYLPMAAPGALVLVNSSIVSERVEGDRRAVYVPCVAIADELGSAKTANMAMVGAYSAATGYLKEETLEELLRGMFTGPKAALVERNMQAMRRGAECVVRG